MTALYYALYTWAALWAIASVIMMTTKGWGTGWPHLSDLKNLTVRQWLALPLQLAVLLVFLPMLVIVIWFLIYVMKEQK